ncbi:hypothetical protein LSM04_002781 [Trypanosoma melophagium]|uniref:uncharacterized protein n=1 Tax=Trypanosoma melophagium TaxID=715481 RepID=UPI003519E490|nr:hypothetical protein LSM04_002781 [Trypanosoma melophagium]
MSGIRVAEFSKYFAVGMTLTALFCARHCSWVLTHMSADLQEHYRTLQRYADQVAALEMYAKENRGKSTLLLAGEGEKESER